MRENLLKRRLEKSDICLGMQLFSGSPGLLEIMGYSGFDWVMIDTEHGPVGVLDTIALEHLVRASRASGITPIVRVTENNPKMVMKAFDAGAMGILVPHTKTKEDAVRMVQAAKYMPAGTRGVCHVTEAGDFGLMDLAEYLRVANDETMVMALIEDREGVENIEEIVAVEGVDAVMIGPFELSISLGVTGQIEEGGRNDHALMVKARDRVIDVCLKAAVPYGDFLWDFNATKTLLGRGMQLPLWAPDYAVFLQACKDVVAKIKGGNGPVTEKALKSS